MRERTKLYVDMLKASTVGFLGAVLFRDFSWPTDTVYTILGAASFAGAWRLTGTADRDKDD